jgi:hypothetical protein
MSTKARTVSRLAAAFVIAALAAVPAVAQSSDERLQRPRDRSRELKAAVAQAQSQSASPEVAELARRIELVAAELETMKLGEAAVEADTSVYGLGPAASKVYRKAKGVSIGGYGELLYQNFSGSNDAGAPSGKLDDLDVLRGIVYVGYKWSDRWILNTEFEWEHGSTGKNGEASVEFAYVDRLFRPEVNVRAGLVLIPMGLAQRAARADGLSGRAAARRRERRHPHHLARERRRRLR